MNVRYRVELSQSERAELRQLLSGGKQPVRKLKRAQILLAADEGVSDEDIASAIRQHPALKSGSRRTSPLGRPGAAFVGQIAIF